MGSGGSRRCKPTSKRGAADFPLFRSATPRPAPGRSWGGAPRPRRRAQSADRTSRSHPGSSPEWPPCAKWAPGIRPCRSWPRSNSQRCSRRAAERPARPTAARRPDCAHSDAGESPDRRRGAPRPPDPPGSKRTSLCPREPARIGNRPGPTLRGGRCDENERKAAARRPAGSVAPPRSRSRAR